MPSEFGQASNIKNICVAPCFLASEFAIKWIARGGLHFHVFCSNSDAADGRNSNILILDSITVCLDLSRFSAHLFSTRMKSSFLIPHECCITLHAGRHRTFSFSSSTCFCDCFFFFVFLCNLFSTFRDRHRLVPYVHLQLQALRRTAHHDTAGSEMLNVTSFPAPPSTFVLENCSSCLYQAEAPLERLKGETWLTHIWGKCVVSSHTHPIAMFPLQFFIFLFFGGET